jgi:hypothetical protein
MSYTISLVLERLERLERLLERIYLYTKMLIWSRRTLVFRVCLKVERVERMERVFFKSIYRKLFFLAEDNSWRGTKTPSPGSPPSPSTPF